MSNGKNIEIKIAATGGDQAAAEVRKPAEAVAKTAEAFAKPKLAIEALIVSEQGLEQKRGGFLTAAQAEIAEIERETAALDRAEKEMNKWKDAQAGAAVAMAKTGEVLGNLADRKNTVTAANVRMGGGFQNVGYQVQDLAVQIGSGTSAFRALGQQIPQLLSGFGPMGIAIGTVSAVALPLAGALFSIGNGAESAGDKADEAAPKLKKLQDVAGEIERKKSAADLKTWLDALDDEEQAYRDQNVVLTRNVELLTLRRAAQLGVDSARREAEIATIQADPNKSDADKIRETAAIRETEAKAQAQEKLDALADKRRAEKQKQDQAMDDGLRAKEDEVAAASRKRELEKEKVELARKVAAADKAKEALPAAVAAENDARTVQFAAASERYSPEDQAKLKVQYEDLKRQREATEAKANSVTGKDRARLAGGDIDNEIKQVTETITAAAAKKNEAEERARTAADAARKAEEIQNIQAPAIISQYESGRDARTATSDAAARKAVAAEAKGYFKDYQDYRRTGEKETRDETRDDRAAGKVGRDAERLLPKGVSEKFRKAVQDASERLQDGDQGGELEELAGLLAQLGASSNAALSGVRSELAKVRNEIAILQKQRKNQ